jgi:predicted ATPase
LSFVGVAFIRNRLLATYRKSVASWIIYPGLDTRRGSAVRAPTLARHETQVETGGDNLVAVLHTLYMSSREFKREINQAMQAAFGDDFEELVFPPAADQLIQLRVRWKSLQREVSAADLSDGTLRFLFLLAVLANPDPPALIAIEEPEIGLHPSMLPIVAEFAAEAANRTQVILTTHSSDFLSAFREPIPAVTVCHCENGETNLKTMTGQDLEYWLKEYTLGELYRSKQLEAAE